jgi:hypothetical protein
MSRARRYGPVTVRSRHDRGARMKREELLKRLAENPRFKKAAKPSVAYILVGWKRHRRRSETGPTLPDETGSKMEKMK